MAGKANHGWRTMSFGAPVLTRKGCHACQLAASVLILEGGRETNRPGVASRASALSSECKCETIVNSPQPGLLAGCIYGG